MSEHHISSSDRELYVIGALDPARSAELEAHMAACAACESALMAEASLELAFEQVARSPVRARRAVRAASFVGAGAGALAMAAAILLWLVPGAGPRAGGASTAAGMPGAAMQGDPGYTGSADASGSTARLDTSGVRHDDELDGG